MLEELGFAILVKTHSHIDAVRDKTAKPYRRGGGGLRFQIRQRSTQLRRTEIFREQRTAYFGKTGCVRWCFEIYELIVFFCSTEICLNDLLKRLQVPRDSWQHRP